MDIFSHGLWTWLVCKYANLHLRKKINIKLTVFFGVLPDIISFTLLFVWLISGLVLGTISFGEAPHPAEIEPAAHNTFTIGNITGILYSLSHSIISFIVVFLLVWIFYKPFWPLLGWLFHIIIDIPSHSYRFYPTPFLWPISGWKFDGISWANPWFMAVNYLLIIAFYFYLRHKARKSVKS